MKFPSIFIAVLFAASAGAQEMSPPGELPSQRWPRLPELQPADEIERPVLPKAPEAPPVDDALARRGFLSRWFRRG